jgi:hypothetical protein
MKTFINYLNENVDPNKITEKEQIAYVRREWENIKNINNPSLKVQLAAVNEYPFLLKYINLHKQIELEAVKNNPSAIQWIKNPSEEMKLIAIQDNPNNIFHIENPSKEIQLIAIKKNPRAITHNPCKEAQLIAVRNDNDESNPIIMRINNPCKEAQLIAASKINFNALDYNHSYNEDGENYINKLQEKIKDGITKEIYYKAPKDFPWLPEIKNKFKDIDKFKRFNL